MVGNDSSSNIIVSDCFVDSLKVNNHTYLPDNGLFDFSINWVRSELEPLQMNVYRSGKADIVDLNVFIAQDKNKYSKLPHEIPNENTYFKLENSKINYNSELGCSITWFESVQNSGLNLVSVRKLRKFDYLPFNSGIVNVTNDRAVYRFTGIEKQV